MSPAIDLFNPTRQTGVALNARMAKGLHASLTYMFAQIGAEIAVDGARASTLMDRLAEGSRESPELYRRHYQLVTDIGAGDLTAANNNLNTMLDLPAAEQTTRVLTPGSGKDGDEALRLLPYFAAEPDTLFEFSAPPSTEAKQATLQITAAMELIERCLPGLAGEIDETIVWVVVASGHAKPNTGVENARFGGGSTFKAYGSVLLNCDPANSVSDRALSIVHEATHNALFAFAPGDGLVENDLQDRFRSPLRRDKRPIEGIYHATFVIARLAYTVRQMMASGRLDRAQREQVEQALPEYRARFNNGMAVLNDHARYTGLGRDAIDQARAHMAGVD